MDARADRARFTDPYEIDVPPEARFIGEAPYWSRGDTVTWTCRRFDFDRDRAEVRRPMQVIEDGPAGAVLWLPGGTPTTDTRIVGWEDTNPHDVPLRARFGPADSAPRRVGIAGAWRGLGVLKIVPARVPFSVWVLLKPGASAGGDQEFPGTDAGDCADGSGIVEWYVNLEATHRRTNTAIFTSDHILDITFPRASTASGTPASADPHPSDFLHPEAVVFKDVDELAAAARYGMWPAAWSDIIRRNGMSVLENLDHFAWAFDPRWERLAVELAGTGGKAGDRAPSPKQPTTGDQAEPHERGPGPEQPAAGESHRVRGGCYDRDWI